MRGWFNSGIALLRKCDPSLDTYLEVLLPFSLQNLPLSLLIPQLKNL